MENFDESLVGMKLAGGIVSKILDDVELFVKVGISTKDIDDFCLRKISEYKANPALIGYMGYKHASCVSVNDVVCHGVPRDDVFLENGDIVSVDITIEKNGFHGDSCRTFLIGDVFKSGKNGKHKLAERLVRTTYECMMKGIEAAKPGNALSDIGIAIQTVAQREGLSVVRDFCGHGIGRSIHEKPSVLHYYIPGNKDSDIKIKPGMFFTVEPMINVGSYGTCVMKDGWTAVTIDGSLSAQFEHTIAITENGNVIMTVT